MIKTCIIAHFEIIVGHVVFVGANENFVGINVLLPIQHCHGFAKSNQLRSLHSILNYPLSF